MVTSKVLALISGGVLERPNVRPNVLPFLPSTVLGGKAHSTSSLADDATYARNAWHLLSVRHALMVEEVCQPRGRQRSPQHQLPAFHQPREAAGDQRRFRAPTELPWALPIAGTSV